MKKISRRSKVTLIIVACILGAFIVVNLGFLTYANARNDYSKPSADLSVWMSYIKDDALVKDIVIPGSHDSATDDMVYLARTQMRSVKDQLLCGARYLDLRVGYKNGVLKVFHGPVYGGKYEPVLKQVKEYISAHPTELIIFDLQHFDNDAKADAIALTVSYLSDYFVTNDTELSDVAFIDSLRLSACRGKILFLLGEDKGESESNNYIFKRNNDDGNIEDAVIRSDYVADWNGASSTDYVDKYLPVFMDNYKANPVGLFVLQGQLSDFMYVRGLKFREATHAKRMDDYTRALATSPDLKYVNIILRDFVGPKKNALILSLNINKGVVASAHAETFTALCAIAD